MDKVNVQIQGDEYWIQGGHFTDMLEAVKQVRGRRYDPQEKIWILMGTPEQVAEAVRPYHLMWVDDDPLADSTPNRVMPR